MRFQGNSKFEIYKKLSEYEFLFNLIILVSKSMWFQGIWLNQYIITTLRSKGPLNCIDIKIKSELS